MKRKNFAIVLTVAVLMVGGYFLILTPGPTPAEGDEQPPPDVFTPVDASGWVDPLLPDDAILRSRPVAVNMATLALVTPPNPNAAVPAVPVRLNLFDDVSVTVVFHKAKPRYDIQIPENPFDLLGQEFEPVGYTWSGDIVGNHGGYAIMVTHGAKCVASVHVTDVGSFVVRPIPGEQHVVRELDASLPLESCTESPVSAAGQGGGAAGAGAECDDIDYTGCDDGSVVDIMVVYTPAALTQAGGDPDDMDMLVEAAVADANRVYINSAVNTRLRLVYKGLIDDPTGQPLQQLRLQWDGILDDVHSLRNSHRADLVCLFTATGQGQGLGQGYLPTEESPFHEGWGFSTVYYGNASSSHVFAHETGHNRGCAHDRRDACPCDVPGESCADCEETCVDNCDCKDGVCVYSYGHHFGPDPEMPEFRTVMTTSPGGMKVAHYSNPNVLYPLPPRIPLYPTGVAYPSPSCNSADCAQTINLTRDTVANYRQSCDTTDTTSMASKDYFAGQGEEESSSVSLSDNGQYIAFASDADNFVGGQWWVKDIFLYNRESGLVSVISRHGGGGSYGHSYSPVVSGNGRYVAFASDAGDIDALGSDDTNNLADIYVWEQPIGFDGDLRRVSLTSSQGQALGGHSTSPSISFDGASVVFESDATNLVGGLCPVPPGGSGDCNGYTDIFHRDFGPGVTSRVSVSTAGEEANGPSSNPSISASTDPDEDGRFVAFESDADNLVTGDTPPAAGGHRDIFVRDRGLEVTTRVSVSTANDEANDDSFAPSISADGQLVAFESDANNLLDGQGQLPDTNIYKDIFVRNLAAQPDPVTIRVSVAPDGTDANGDSFAPVISADGLLVAFHSDATNLLGPGIDTNGQTDVFVYNATTGEIFRASIDSAGAQATGGGSSDPAMTANGRFVAFESEATNLVSGDTTGFRDIFFHDRSCLGDLNGDLVVGPLDLAMLLSAWGPVDDCPPSIPPDFDQNCDVGPADLAILLAAWGSCL